jgi:carbamoyltransferase
MIILGINAFHADSSAALVQDGNLIAAAEEERFRRIKHIGSLSIKTFLLVMNRLGPHPFLEI